MGRGAVRAYLRKYRGLAIFCSVLFASCGGRAVKKSSGAPDPSKNDAASSADAAGSADGASGSSDAASSDDVGRSDSDADSAPLPVCFWPEAFSDAATAECTAGRVFLSCVGRFCLSNDPERCPGDTSTGAPYPGCTNLCNVDEYGVMCDVLKVPRNCRTALQPPGGLITFACCPCNVEGTR